MYIYIYIYMCIYIYIYMYIHTYIHNTMNNKKNRHVDVQRLARVGRAGQILRTISLLRLSLLRLLDKLSGKIPIMGLRIPPLITKILLDSEIQNLSTEIGRTQVFTGRFGQTSEGRAAERLSRARGLSRAPLPGCSLQR